MTLCLSVVQKGLKEFSLLVMEYQAAGTSRVPKWVQRVISGHQNGRVVQRRTSKEMLHGR